MSYDVDVVGSFKIDPELTRAYERELAKEMECENKQGDPCPWELSEDGTQIIPTEYETKRSLEDWLRYIVSWLTKREYQVRGEATWEGENPKDKGKLVVSEGKVQVYRGKVVYELKTEGGA